MSSYRDVTLLARRRVLPLVSYVAYASVTPATVISLPPSYIMCKRISNK